MLSEENRKKIIETGLYSHKPISNSYTATSGYYWCKNWTFKPHFYDDGEVWMFDTFYDDWNSHKIQLTDKNFDEFEFIFDFNEVERCDYEKTYNYDEKDFFTNIATNSGGYSCGGLTWIKKNAKPVPEKQIAVYKDKIEELKHRIEYAQDEIKRTKEKIKTLKDKEVNE